MPSRQPQNKKGPKTTKINPEKGRFYGIPIREVLPGADKAHSITLRENAGVEDQYQLRIAFQNGTATSGAREAFEDFKFHNSLGGMRQFRKNVFPRTKRETRMIQLQEQFCDEGRREVTFAVVIDPDRV